MRFKTKAAIVGALFLLLGPLAGATAAAPPDDSGVVIRGDGPIGFIYWGEGYLAITGTAEEFCTNPGPPSGPGGMTVNLPSGGTLEFSRADVPVSVYEYPGPDATTETPGGGFEFLGDNCAAIFDDDPTTVPAQAVAAGEVRLRVTFRTDADGVTNSHNSMVGRVRTSDGDDVHLGTFAKLSFTDGGATLISIDQIRLNYGVD